MTLPDENKDTPTEPLSNDQIEFMVAYFECNANATRAWMKVHPGCEYASAKSQASAYLTNLNLREAIRQTWISRAMGVEEAIARMSAIAQADLHPFVRIDDDGFTYFNFADVDAQEYLFLIKKMKTKRERRIDGNGPAAQEWEGEWVEVELHDAYTALRDIAKMHGKLTERVDISNNDGSLKPEQMKPSEIADRVVALLKQKNDTNSG